MCKALNYKKTRVRTYNWKTVATVYVTHGGGLGDSVASKQGKEMMLLAKITNWSRRAGFRDNKWLQFWHYYTLCKRRTIYKWNSHKDCAFERTGHFCASTVQDFPRHLMCWRIEWNGERWSWKIVSWCHDIHPVSFHL